MNIAICDDDRVIIEQIEEFLQIIHDKSLEYEVFFLCGRITEIHNRK